MVLMAPDSSMLWDSISAQRKVQGTLFSVKWPARSQMGLLLFSDYSRSPHGVSPQAEGHCVPKMLDQAAPSQKPRDLSAETTINEGWFWGGCSDLEVGAGTDSDDLQKSLMSFPWGGWSCGFPELD